MAKRFLKLNLDNDEADFLAAHHPNAFILLYFIARRARRTSGSPDGLHVGECHLGDWESLGLSRQNYRTALRVLVSRLTIEILETNRNRKKLTTGLTTEGTKVKLLNSTIWDINPEDPNHRPNHCLTTDQPLPNHEQEDLRRDKKDHHPYPSASGLTDDFSSKGKEEEAKTEVYPGVLLSSEDLAACIKIKGTIEKVKSSIEFIQNSPKRNSEITDWPNAISRWKTEGKSKAKVQDHIAYAEKLCVEFPEFDNGRGWRCYAYNDRKKDQRGLLFESESAYQEAFFVPLIDGEFMNKCEEFINSKNMRKNEKYV